jgi:hypothetical protein
MTMERRLLVIGFGVLAAATASAAKVPAISPACDATEYHQLDFWTGDWDAFDADSPVGSPVARTHVDRIAEGCGLHEIYEQEDGLVGDSILSYDAARRQWQQTWITNRGSLMVITGNLKDGRLVLEGEVHRGDGGLAVQRISWHAEGEGVRESALVSRDQGKTWSPAFDVLFLRHKDSRP